MILTKFGVILHSMLYDNLNISLINDPSRWRLMLRIAPESLAVMTYDPSTPGSLKGAIFALDDTLPHVAAVEKCIYANSLLTAGGFASVECSIVDTTPMLLPSITSEEYITDALAFTSSAIANDEERAIVCETGAENAIMAAPVGKKLAAFLARTFNNPAVYPHLASLTRFCMTHSRRGNNRKLYLNFRPRENAIDLIATDCKRLLMANSFPCKVAENAVYYVQAVRQALGLDNITSPVMLSGSSPLRNRVAELLRSLGTIPSPVQTPEAMLETGPDIDELPFDLAVMPHHAPLQHI